MSNDRTPHSVALALSWSKEACKNQLEFVKALKLHDTTEIENMIDNGSKHYDFFIEVLSKFFGANRKMYELEEVLRSLNLSDVLEFLEELDQQHLSSESAIQFNVPPSTSFFFGRTQDLTTIHDILTKDNIEIATKHRLCITGVSGIGKTALAVKYAHLNSAYYDSNVIFIDGGSKSSFSNGIRQLAYDLKLSNSLQDKTQLKTLIDKICQKLPPKWLLILDNTPDESILDYFPNAFDPKVHTPHVLITCKEVNRRRKSVNPVFQKPLEGLLQREAEDLIKKSLKGNPETSLYGIDSLAARFNGHPLCLLQAVHYINEKLINHEAHPIVRYLFLFGTNEKEILKYNKTLKI